MTYRMFAAAVVGLCLTAGAAEAGILTGPVAYNGHTYYLLTESTWSDAQAEAVTLGGNLVTINDAAENDFVYNTFAPSGGANPTRNLWTGFTDVAVEGTFAWVSGEPAAYTKWSRTEPNGGTTENYAYIIGSNGYGGTPQFWNDIADGSPIATFYGVVEVNGVPAAVPEPASAVLAGVGGLALAAWRRRRAARA